MSSETALRNDRGILAADDVLNQILLPRDPRAVSNARVPMLAARNGRLHVFRAPDGGTASINMRSRSAHPIAASPCWSACIPPALQATCWAA